MAARAVLLPALSLSSGRRPRYRWFTQNANGASASLVPNICERLARKPQMQGAPQADTGSVHERTLRMAAEEQRRRWGFIASLYDITY